MRIHIIIPFFQRESGILAKAVRSVMAQEGVFDATEGQIVELIVVDDASPVTADSELAGIQFPPGLKCRVIRQANQGPGGARNTGLDAATADGLVAFLDSDDEWTPHHLRRALTALRGGYDVYGCNWVPLGAERDAMTMPVRQSLRLAPSELLDNAGEVVGDPLISEMTAPMCKLSGLAYRVDRFPSLRFDTRFRNASEDVLFVYTMMLARPRVMISTDAEVRSGRGINVYESATWGSPASLKVIYDQTLATRHACGLLHGREDAMTILGNHLGAQRRSFAENCWHMLPRLRLPLRQVLRHVLLDPAVIGELLRYPWRRIFTRASSG